MRLSLNWEYEFVMDDEKFGIYRRDGVREDTAFFNGHPRDSECLKQLQVAGITPRLFAKRFRIEKTSIANELYMILQYTPEMIEKRALRARVTRKIAKEAVSRRKKAESGNGRFAVFGQEFMIKHTDMITEMMGREIAKCKTLEDVSIMMKEKMREKISAIYTEKYVMPELEKMKYESRTGGRQ